MKLHLATPTTQNIFTGYGDGFVSLAGRKISHSVVVTADQIIEPWATAGFARLRAEDFHPLLDLAPEIVLFGSGAAFRFLHPSLTQVFAAKRIGVEVMDTPAACRTYNVLLAEGRRVVAALIIDPA
ncbi:MAG: Mth938-like domain-containing protein [Burkholderiales bacterium]